jgi:hypothetical protein
MAIVLFGRATRTTMAKMQEVSCSDQVSKLYFPGVGVGVSCMNNIYFLHQASLSL